MQISQEAIEYIIKNHNTMKKAIILAYQAPVRACCYITMKPFIFLTTYEEFQKEISLGETDMNVSDFEVKNIVQIPLPIYWHFSIKDAWESAEIDLTADPDLILFLHDQ